ncbi:hypothetical protein F4805DRAFT_472769 [Annulohypoxylon moriforme]|nr:hypothetical protein F4805DRAFT_472769 [Annulohypoxylon moriforme]
MEAPNHHRLIIGIDFGTTYTGVGWVESEGSNITTIKKWPSRESQGLSSCPKVPTKLRYLDNGEIEWGFQISSDAQPQDILSLFKLGLELDRYRNSIDMVGKFLDFENVDLNITDYLSKVVEYALSSIQKCIGNGTFNNRIVDFVLTVPAIWSEVSKQRTIQAFERIPNLPQGHSTTLLSEPEAAATAALRDLNQSELQVNDSFVVVDAGGGTVDLITYTITSLIPGLEVTEATEGTGDFCGSSRLNDRFIQFITSRLGGEEGWGDVVLHHAVEYFENNTKRTFEVSALAQNQEFTVPVRGLGINPDVGIHRPGRLSLKADQLHLFFEPDMIKISQLVKDQIAMAAVPIKKILLVGGYGSSIYLKERLQLAIREDSSIRDDIEVLQPPNSWVSVVKGAVMKGLFLANPVNYKVPIVKARTARKHYGYICGMPFNPNEHQSLLSKRYYDGMTGCWRVTVMDWIIKRGELVSENKPFLRTYFFAQPVIFGRVDSITTDIFSDEVSMEAPLEKGKNVVLLCRVTANLDHIPEHDLGRSVGADGQTYYDIEYQIESICQRYGTVTAEYV